MLIRYYRHGAFPIVVFDGMRLPGKAYTHSKRARIKEIATGMVKDHFGYVCRV